MDQLTGFDLVEPAIFFFNEPFWGVYLLTSLQLHVWLKNQYILCGGFKCVHLQMIRIARTVSCQELTPPKHPSACTFKHIWFFLQNSFVQSPNTTSCCSITRKFFENFSRNKPPDANCNLRLNFMGCGVSKAGFLSQFKDEPRERLHGLPTEKWMVERNWWRFVSAVFFLGTYL